MLIPQFTIRFIFALTTCAAMLAWVISQAVNGAIWAQSVAWSALFVVVLFSVYAGLFLAALSVSASVAARNGAKPTSPFGSPNKPVSQPPVE